MNWIKKQFKAWFREQCKEAWYTDSPVLCKNNEIRTVDDTVLDFRKSYTVRMQPANGGTIIEVSHYNERAGDFNKDLFIVNDGIDLGSEISKILVQYKLTHS